MVISLFIYLFSILLAFFFTARVHIKTTSKKIQKEALCFMCIYAVIAIITIITIGIEL